MNRLSAASWLLAGLLLLALLLAPPLRAALEASMKLQMLLQFPALLLAGALLGAGLARWPGAPLRALARWNALGISGLFIVLLVLSVLMIPRALDLALVEPRVEALKVGALLLAGALAAPSWRAAGWVVQGFFLGNLLPMMVIAGTLYQNSPQRLCNAYLLADQQQLGLALVWVAALAALVWVGAAMWRFSRNAPEAPG